LAVGIETG